MNECRLIKFNKQKAEDCCMNPVIDLTFGSLFLLSELFLLDLSPDDSPSRLDSPSLLGDTEARCFISSRRRFSCAYILSKS